jgi:hypothetical protein
MVRVLISVLIVVLVLPAYLLGCRNTEFAEREDSVVPKAAISPVDAITPMETETATFALG